MKKRSSGVLLHITSLPSPYGIGDLGPSAYKFVDFLSNSKQTYWQILPLNITEVMFGNSPYSSISAFAANTLLISPDLLKKDGLISDQDIKNNIGFQEDRVDYPAVQKYKVKLFDIAYETFKKKTKNDPEFVKFCKEHSYWLDDFSMFFIIKQQYKEGAWNEWPADLKVRKQEKLNEYKNKFSDEITKVKFLQFQFYKQWFKLKDYANEKGILLFGDVPIYVNFDSVDVWTNPEMFNLDEDENPVVVSGVPPDYFSETGQRWGNPVYNWEKLKETRYSWWIMRMSHNLHLFDWVRIDHFRGLVAYWEIPAEEKTAINGRWVNVPCDDFFNELKKKFPELPIIAEDLGHITDDVKDAMKRFELPGMKILLFAFNGDMQTHPYLPHNFGTNCVVYTGTHDNNTVNGWFKNEATDQEKNNINDYVGKKITISKISWQLIDIAMKSNAYLAITPMQDILGLGQDCRMNKPGTVENNWEWRLLPEAVKDNIIKKLADLTQNTNRV